MINNFQYIIPMELLYLYDILLSTNMMPLKGRFLKDPLGSKYW
jgi:hypothetical protein